MPYMDETELRAGAIGQIVWTWPFEIGIPTLQEITDRLFPRPILPLLPKWGQTILDKWNWFADLFHTRLSALAGEEIEGEETYLDLIVEAAEWAAGEMEIDMWDEEEGLPSMPLYTAPIGPSTPGMPG